MGTFEQHVIAGHLQSATAARLYPAGGPWGRALAWWRRAAEIAPVLPLGLAADLGALLVGWDADHMQGIGDQAAGLGTAERQVAGPEPDDECAAFLRAAADAPAVEAARAIGLGDLAVAAVLAHLAQGAPVSPEYRLPPGTDSAAIAEALAEQLERPALSAQPSALSPQLSTLIAHLLTRLRALSPTDVRFAYEIGRGALGITDLADLRALVELLGLPSLSHALLDEVLAFTPALADVAPGATAQHYAVDGYGGLTRAGSLDAALPSEWALPAELTSYRFLNGELLSYGYERPPERLQALLLLLVQLGDAMAGDLEVLAKASALALGRAALAHGMAVQLACFDAVLHPPQKLTRPAEVAALVRQKGQGMVDLPHVLAQVQAHVRAQVPSYTQIELLWLLHAQAGADQASMVAALADQLHRLATSRALFVRAGEAAARPLLAGRLAGQWATVGSTALHDAEERAKAVRALRALAIPRPGARLAAEPCEPQRRVVAPPADPAQTLLDQERWEELLDELEPRARAGDTIAALLLATMVEDTRSPAPLTLRLHAAGLLGAVGDPRLLDLQIGDSAAGAYWHRVEAGPVWYGDERQGELRRLQLTSAVQIGRYPVTNAEYLRFIKAGGYAQRAWWTAHGWPILQASTNRFWSNGRQVTHPWNWADPEYNQPGQPVVGVSWWEALAYCAWLTAQGRAAGWLAASDVIRLPTSLEWERAARGDDRRRYPWGDAAPNPERANYDQTGLGRPSPVGCFPQGAAASGALDMAGNIMEWLATFAHRPEQCAPLRDADPDTSVMLSEAAFDDNAAALGCGARSESGPFARYPDRGFRLVRCEA